MMDSLKARFVVKWLFRSFLGLLFLRFLQKRRTWLKGVESAKKTGLPMVLVKDSFLQRTMLGHIPVLAKHLSDIYDFRLNLLLKHGPTCTWLQPIWEPEPTISTMDPVNVKYILRDNFENFMKSNTLEQHLKDLLGKGIFVVNHGCYSRKMPLTLARVGIFNEKLVRRDSLLNNSFFVIFTLTASKVFTRNVFKTKVHETLIKNTRRLCNILDECAKEKKTIDIQNAFFKFTMDTIGDIGFGVELNTLSKDTVPFAKAFDDVQKLIPNRILRVDLGLFNFVYPTEWAIDRCIRILDSFSYNIIKERKSLGSQLAKNGDILSLFVQADPNLPDKFLRDIVMSFFIAGRDTTACTLSFTFLLLAQHQDKQNSLRKEIRAHLSKKEGFVNLDDLASMPYLNGVVMECLRMYPPVPIDGKQACAADVLPDGTKIVPGTKIIYETYCMGRNPDVWDDPDSFIPERWLNRDPPSEYEFPVFQGGPRFCLGRDLAIYEAKFLTAELIKRYHIELDGQVSDPPYMPGITMTVRGGLPLKFARSL